MSNGEREKWEGSSLRRTGPMQEVRGCNHPAFRVSGLGFRQCCSVHPGVSRLPASCTHARACIHANALARARPRAQQWSAAQLLPTASVCVLVYARALACERD